MVDKVANMFPDIGKSGIQPGIKLSVHTPMDYCHDSIQLIQIRLTSTIVKCAICMSIKK